MANHKSAKKRKRQDIKRNAKNKAQLSEVKTALKQIRAAIKKKDKKTLEGFVPKIQSALSRLAQKGVIKRNKASRLTSRLSTQAQAK